MIQFTKMHGIGNDFVMLDGITSPLPETDLSQLAKAVCDRRFGIGSDGLIALDRGTQAEYRMRMWNPDGTEGGMCGNGARCAGLMLSDLGLMPANTAELEVGERLTTLNVCEDGTIRVDMSEPEFRPQLIGLIGVAGDRFVDQELECDGQRWKATALSMGNPHIVLHVDDVDAFDLARLGPQIETHPMFANRTNVHAAQVVGPSSVQMKTWERGAGITLACGSGACAVAVACIETGRVTSPVHVHLPGGELNIEWLGGPVLMTGPAAYAFAGVWDPV